MPLRYRIDDHAITGLRRTAQAMAQAATAGNRAQAAMMQLSEAARRASRQGAQQDTATARAQRVARQNVDWVRRRINGLNAQSVARISQLYAEGARSLAEQWRLLIEQYGESNWPMSAPLSAQARAARTQALLQQVDAAITRWIAQAQDQTLAALLQSYRQSYYATGWVLDQQLPEGVITRLPLLPHQAVVAAVEAPYQGLTYLERYAEQRPALLYHLRRTIVHSQIAGDSVSQATSRLLRELGVPVGGGTLVKDRRQAAATALNVTPLRRFMTPRKHAELLVRTEIARSAATATEAIYDINDDVVKGKIWTATLDRITCPACGRLDGRSWMLNDDDAPTIPKHPRCRCAWAPITKTFAELGLSGLGRYERKPRQTYRQWAEERGISDDMDGGLRQQAKLKPGRER